MTKIYISPSSQPENEYAYGNTNEQAQCNKIALATVKALKRCGFEAKTNTNGTMYSRASESNEWGADAHIPIHTNAATRNVKGTRLFSYDNKNEGYKICVSVMETLAPITPGTSDSITSANFYEITATNAPCCYVEVAFHDNVEEAKWIVEHTDEIAEAITKGLCNYYGVKYVAPSATTQSSVEKYTLVVDCKTYMNADNAKSRTDSVGKYKAGSYYVYKKANGMINISKNKGKAGAWINPSDNKKTATKPKKTAKEIAKEIYYGTCSDSRWTNWGTGSTRVSRLKQAGYNPNEVQKEVNKLF